MIPVTPTVAIDEKEIEFDFVRASGPGGQNVNKVSSAAVLHYDVLRSSLPSDVQQRLIRLAGKRVTKDGVLVLKGQQFRTQERNKQDLIERLVELVASAVVKPKSRLKTKPTRASRERTLEEKSRRSNIKAQRRVNFSSDE